ncbi:MAG TPA: hypothetical protein V6C84_14015 [Coleofasciculaceae cyanobacterium]
MIRKLLLLGALLVWVQHLGRTALAKVNPVDSPENLTQTSQIQESQPQSVEVNEAEPKPLAMPQSPGAANAPLHQFLLSTLVLPLPPLLIPDLLLPPYNFPSFNSNRLDQELRIYTQYLRTTGTPDILIVGSSRSLQGIDPIALQQALVKQGYPELKIFNFGINGGTAKVNEILLRRILTAEQLPRLIIWGDGSRAFNNGRPDLTYNGIVASEGYRHLASGDRPIPSHARWDLPVLRAAANKALATPATAAEHPSDLDAYGFQKISAVYNPETYYQRYPWVPGAYDADYIRFNLNGDQQKATVAVAELAKSQNVPLVFVNLPLTADYLDATRLNYEQQFRQSMQRLAGQAQFIFCDLSQQRDLMQNGYFADPSHINHRGAAAIGAYLATVPSIPWSMFKPEVQADPEPSALEDTE